MNIPLLSYLVNLIEELLKKDGPVVAKAAGAAAVAGAESDPKVQAITAATVAVLAATKTLKTAVDAHPDAPEITPATK
jgi:transcriptional regulator of nitric oxide reductase